METKLISATEFLNKCKQRKEIKARRSNDYYKAGIIAYVRSPIIYYNGELIEKIVNAKPWRKYIYDSIPRTLQENKYLLTVDENDVVIGIEKMYHKSKQTYSSPFCDMGMYGMNANRGLLNGDCDMVIDAMIIDTQSFPIGDSVVEENFAQWLQYSTW